MSDPGTQKNDGDEDGNLKAIRLTGPLLTAGIQMAVTIVAMVFIGRWLDTKFGTDPWLMTVFGLLGSGGGLFSFIRTALAAGKAESEQRPSDRGK